MRLPVLLAFLSGPLAIACGGGQDPATPGRTADGGVDSGAALLVRPPPSGLPAMAQMPPPGVAGSRKATVRPDPVLGGCSAAVAPSAKDATAQLKKIGDACAAAKMKAVGAALRGTQGDRDAHQENKVHVEAGRCYRVYLATDDAVKSAVVVMRDSAGDIVVEGPAPAIPASGSACFTAADDVTLLVGVGSGKGAWAAQLVSD